MTNQKPTPAEIRLAQYGERTSTWSTATYDSGTEKALHEIALELKAELDRLREKHKASLQRADQINNELMEEVQRYAEGTEQPVLWSVYKAMHLRAANAESAITRVRQLHDRLAEETDLSGPDDLITKGSAARRIATALDGWNPALLPAVGARQPDTETPTIPCSWVAVKSSHTPHTWAPQPGMDPVPCAGYTTPLTDQPTVEPERPAAADTDGAHVAPYCDGFPTTCPNPVTVPPAPPHHDGGIRCGCYDEEA